jgi:hypothetical protein
MTEKEFLELVIENASTYYIDPDRKSYWYGGPYKLRPNSKKAKAKISLDTDYLYSEWYGGGVGGGSCWDDGNRSHYPVPGEAETDITAIDDILMKVCPNLTFLQYRKLMNGVEDRGNYTNNEYYGNSSTHNYKVINLRKLYDRLKEMELI